MANTSIPQVKIVNCETGEEIVRDANAEELAQIEADKSAQVAYEAAKAQQAADKAALLTRLGLTEEELKTILG
tara:strand:+ start:80 stop:298 length:219 start_codon:yes stop_codon:yes gene_type:complete